MDYNFASKIQCICIAIGLVFHNGSGADNTDQEQLLCFYKNWD